MLVKLNLRKLRKFLKIGSSFPFIIISLIKILVSDEVDEDDYSKDRLHKEFLHGEGSRR